MARIPSGSMSSEPRSLVTHWHEQLEVAAQAPWWLWAVLAICVVMCVLMALYLCPRKPKDPTAGLPRDEHGNLIPPWKWEDSGHGTPAQGER